MRIISGSFKGKKILEPKDKQTRPLKDLTKESIFNVITHSNKFKVDFVITKKFDKNFSKTKALNFIIEILNKKLNSKFIFVSNNFRFGNQREGNVDLLIENEKNYNYKVIKPKPLIKDKKIVSSSLIRNLLRKGNLEKANKYLKRNWSIIGKVEKGRKLGKKIGFPTCNIKLSDYVIAKPGVYAVNISINKNKKLLRGIANLGYRPTFNQKEILLEVHIFNFSKNLYNKHLTIEFIDFIRKEKKFKNINQLKKQINLDIRKAKKLN